jgi:hypothetical protein
MHCLFFILPLFPFTLALPTAPLLEQWRIPRLNMHMSSRTGLPGDGTWPLGSRFNSTIDFDVCPRFSSHQHTSHHITNTAFPI